MEVFPGFTVNNKWTERKCVSMFMRSILCLLDQLHALEMDRAPKTLQTHKNSTRCRVRQSMLNSDSEPDPMPASEQFIFSVYATLPSEMWMFWWGLNCRIVVRIFSLGYLTQLLFPVRIHSSLRCS